MGNLLRASVALALVTAIADPSRAFAAPAVVQGVVLFTLFAVFLI